MKRSVPLPISETPQPLPAEHGVDKGSSPSPRSGLFTPRNLELYAEVLEELVDLKPQSAPLVDLATIRQELLRAYPSEDPAVKIAIELVIEALEEYQQVCRLHLEPQGGLLLLDAEHKIKRRAALHLRNMLLALRDLYQRPAPAVQITRAEQVQIAIVSPMPKQRSRRR
ncbi:MAG: hypothetical protein HY694_12595 [Deltaproteobacteria bacterium]|nr:hypothetical protein [Deltaproteobacteria bacterium]